MLVRNQHLLDVVGMIQQNDVKRAEPDMRDLAKLRAHTRQKRQRIAPYLRKAAEHQPSARPRWEHNGNLNLPPAQSKNDTSCNDRDRAEPRKRCRATPAFA